MREGDLMRQFDTPFSRRDAISSMGGGLGASSSSNAAVRAIAGVTVNKPDSIANDWVE